VSGTPLVEATGLTKRYGVATVLDRVSLSIAAGESIALFGPNGAGKTTLTRILATASRPTSGSLAIEGRPVRWHDPRIALRIGWVSHATFLYDDLSALENLRYFAKLHGIAASAERAEALLEELGLAARADDAVRTFSRGMQQRLSVARALLHDPALLLLDEPFTGLDPYAARVLHALLARLHAAGTTLVLTTHDFEQGLRLSDRFVVLAKGKLAGAGSSAGMGREAFEAAYFKFLGVESPAGKPS